MILATHGFLASSIGQIPQVNDADAQAFVNRVYSAGGILSTTEANAVNDLVVDMKADGIWTKMKAIYPMVGASAAACAQNLKSSSFTGSFSGGWTFASTGITPDGTSGYMDTNFNQALEMTLNDTHLSVYLRTFVTTNRYEMGCFNGTNAMFAIGFVNSTVRMRMNDLGTGPSFPIDGRGHWIGNRVISTERRGFFNGNLFDTTVVSSVSLVSNNIYLASLNNNGANSTYAIDENAFTSIGDGLTDTEASDFYNAVQAFQTTLSRQV